MDPVIYGAVCRPKRGRPVCGDAYTVLARDERLLVAVADGLGSGEAASDAAQTAVRTATEHCGEGLVALFDRCHAALQSTRGAALALVAVEPASRQVAAASVGNVEIRSRRAFGFNPVPLSGIVGANYRTPRICRAAYDQGEWLVLHTDGLRPGWDLETALMRPVRDPQDLADQLADAYGRDDDDLTVLVVQLP